MGGPQTSNERFLKIKITKKKNIFPVKKLLIMASGIVLKEYLHYQFDLYTGTNPQSVPWNSCRNLFKM